jgi:hypothetical protein
MFAKKSDSFGRFLVVAILAGIFWVVLFSPLIVRASDFGPPYAATRNASDITDKRATLNGVMYGSDYPTTSAWFEWGTSSTALNNSTKHNSYDETTYGSYKYDISGLKAGTVYYFRAAARNLRGTVYGKVFSFKTNAVGNPQNTNYYGQPTGAGTLTATTESATNISSGSVQLNALVLNQTNYFASTWFEWGTTPGLGYTTVKTPISSLPSVRHINRLTGLAPGTIYYFRAVAENPYYKHNGSVFSFVTARGTSANTKISATTTGSAKVALVTTNTTGSPLLSVFGASALGANTFFPSTILGWLFAIILILALILLATNFFGRPSEKRPRAHANKED